MASQAAKGFLMEHINIELAIVFDEIDWEFSDGAKKAIGKQRTSCSSLIGKRCSIRMSFEQVWTRLWVRLSSGG